MTVGGGKFTNFEDVPRGLYRAIYADPAWKFKTRGKYLGPNSRATEKHYPTMTLAEIKAMPVADVAAKDCILFLWTTSPHLLQALEVMTAWGFKYSTVGFVWAKMLRKYEKSPAMFYDAVADFHMGTGYSTRANAEYCLIGRRGRPPKPLCTIRQIIIAPRREHSRKPDEARDRIAAYVGDVPKLEMNARTPAPGWDAWGNEIERFSSGSQ